MEDVQQDVLDEINALLREYEEYDPANPAIDPAWDALRNRQPAAVPETAAVEAPRRIPVVGHRGGRLNQPSDRRNRAKMEWLMNPPTARPKSRRPPARSTTAVAPTGRSSTPPRPTLEPACVMGPLPPPPIDVEVEPGHFIAVPHFAAHSCREWKTRSGGKRWHVRFNHNGSVRRIREIPQRK